jgi:isoleucyl-tRNA synthetase
MTPEQTNRLGFVTHRLRPVYYSPSSHTALAESELKYTDDHQSHSVYVKFPVEEGDMSDDLRRVWSTLPAVHRERGLNIAIWTTTAWSLPGNAVSHARKDFLSDLGGLSPSRYGVRHRPDSF